MDVWSFFGEHYVITALVFIWCVTWLYNLATRGVCRSKARMEGKTVIITGCDRGIGKATAFDIAARGARVIMACIDVEQAHHVRERIIEETKNSEVIVKSIDLSNMKSVRQFADDINNTESRLDVLIHNAGVLNPQTLVTEEGLNTTLATNHFGPFLLSHLLIELLRSTGKSRIVNVASSMHFYGNLDLNDLNPTIDSSSRFNFKWKMYCTSKLACVLCTKEMARRLDESGVTVNCSHPGLVSTSILWNPCPTRLGETVTSILLPFMKTTVQGAQTSIYLAVDEEVELTSGKYFSNCQERTPDEITDNLEFAKSYWKLCEELVQLRPTDPHL